MFLSNKAAIAGLVLAVVSSSNARVVRRSVGADPAQVNGKAYDYVIVGGGAAGLVLASRLTENSDTTVVVIEAGNDGSQVMERILTPALAYLDGVSVPGSPNDWNYFSNTLGRTLHQPRGKVLGGSTAVNAMYMVRASKIEHDAWASLNPDASEDWSWDDFYPYMKKAENYHPPSDPSVLSVETDESFHGTDGPVHASFPQYIYETARRWVPTLANLGLKTSDPQGGEGWGGYITPLAIDPSDGTRSYAKTAYLDPVSSRGNLDVLVEHQVTKINFDTSGETPRATGVQFARGPDQEVFSVEARYEVILAGGVFGTPQLLQLSGVGPRSVLESADVPVIVDLPGVGEHFQDHVLVNVVWQLQDEITTGDLLVQNQDGFLDEQLQLFRDGRLSESLLSSPNNGIGYVNLRQLFNNDTERVDGFIQGLRENITDVFEAAGAMDPTVQAGYNLTYTTETENIINSDVGVIELLLGSFGSWDQTRRTLSIQAAIQHPMSRGNVRLNTSNPFDTPIINANYLNTDSDWILLREGVRYLRRIVETEPMRELVVAELRPGMDAQSDAEIDDYIYRNAATQYHPASTSSMLPRDHGGVVGPDLKVYGTEGLRVIDSSIVPIGLCAHLMVPTYAIAEKGSDIVKQNPVTPRQVTFPEHTGAATSSRMMVSTTALMALASTFVAAFALL